MSRNILAVYQDRQVSHAVETMAANDIGSVVVLDGSGPCGVFTERDLLAKVIAVDRDPRATPVMEVLSETFPAIDIGATAEEAAAAMIRRKNRLMVFEGTNLVGIITPTDIVRVISDLSVTFDISDVVSKGIVSVDPDTRIDASVRKMWQRRVGSVIVGGEGRPSGIFTERDLLKRVLVPMARLDRQVAEFASTPLITADYGARAREIARMMVTNRIKRMPLYKDNAMVAIVTARDLVEAYAFFGGKWNPRQQILNR